MNKMNKKGFTLIEMLVVIAIIAVLVSIIIPVVGNSTAKAAAATNAANLRSVLAQCTIEQMNGTTFTDGQELSSPAAKEIKAIEAVTDEDCAMVAVDDEGNITNAYFVNELYDIEYYAYYAANGAAPTTTP